MIVSTPTYRFKNTIWFALLLILFASCSVVKDYPARKPFVYKTNIELTDKFTTDERKNLTSQLGQQLHDSIRVRLVDKLVGWEKGPRFFYSVLQNPAAFDSLYASQSQTYMKALLNALGYYRDSSTYTVKIDSVGDQYRTYVNFKVTPGKLFRLDSISYTIGQDSIPDNIDTDPLERLTKESLSGSLIKKGGAFSKPLLSAERDRLTDYYRNNGYLQFSQEEILVVWDTVGIALLRPTLDPLEQAQQFEALQQRRLNPTADVTFRLRANKDTNHLIKYYVGNVTVYPDLNKDTAQFVPIIRQRRRATIVTYFNQFKDRAVVENLYLRRGESYSQRNYLRTLNRFNSIGSWRLVTIDQIPRPNTDTVDFVVRLTPASKYAFDVNIEGSNNRGNVFSEGNLIGFNIGLQNRNFSRGANQATTNFRFGTDLNTRQLAQTRQIALGHVINFPRLIPRFAIPQNLRENARTSFAFNSSLVVRDTFFNVKSFNSSWGYDFNWKNKLLSVRIPNIEYTFLGVDKGLQTLINSNQSYQYIFNDGLVLSTIGSLTLTGSKTITPKNNITNYARFNTELSGLFAGMVRTKFLDTNLYRFIKLDVDLRRTYNIRRSALAFRFFTGAGYEILSKGDPNKRYLPFFKAYFAGGANSMRAWALRKLGPGSTNRSFSRTEAPDRFGDIQLEFNGEYRFYIADISGIKINSALFTDIGNIWYLRENETDFPGGQFKLNKLGRDLAIGVGTGLRIDFGPFLVRVDYAYKAKDPAQLLHEQWFNNLKLLNGQLQLGVTYPF